ncbi:MAG: hypothetical protein EAZ57_10790 [Cytophagales bacterium]|nr:MAG: hypothetical protein EAZ67_11390 [Cytophagales bacterium]TAF59561.1 MAG: hypothetical protein EAZ57_10790 [Cytophagales bacterium]
MVVMLVGCKDCSEDPDAAYQPCKDGEQLDVKTPEELMPMLKSSKWRAVAQYNNVTAIHPPGGDPLVILESRSYRVKRSFEKDSVMTIFTYDLDSLGKEKLRSTEYRRYDLALTPNGKLAVRVKIDTIHPNGTPKIEYIYYYLCSRDKLVTDFTYLTAPTRFYNIDHRD